MSILIMVLIVVGFMISLVGSIMFLVVAFRQSVPWGLAVLLLPFAALVFLLALSESLWVKRGRTSLLESA